MTEEKKPVAVRLVACPRCKKSTIYDVTNPNRPFCSPLCKNEDIIAWAQGSYKVPGPPADDDLEQPKEDDEDPSS